MTARHCRARRARPTRFERPRLTGPIRLLCGLVLVTLAAAIGASGAWADGDPASDVLAGAPVFLAADAGFSPTQQAALTRALGQLAAQGEPVHVAVIASPGDLGSVGQLWQMPQAYARFLGEELSLIDRGTLLVVMPDGSGAVRLASGGVTPEPLPASGGAHGLAAATFADLTAVADASGHRLGLGGSDLRTAAAGSGTALGSIDPGSIIALIVGGVAVAAAWLVSLRIRPWRSPRTAPPIGGP